MDKLMKRYGIRKIEVSDEMLDGSLSYIMNDIFISYIIPYITAAP